MKHECSPRHHLCAAIRFKSHPAFPSLRLPCCVLAAARGPDQPPGSIWHISIHPSRLVRPLHIYIFSQDRSPFPSNHHLCDHSPTTPLRCPPSSHASVHQRNSSLTCPRATRRRRASNPAPKTVVETSTETQVSRSSRRPPVKNDLASPPHRTATKSVIPLPLPPVTPHRPDQRVLRRQVPTYRRSWTRTTRIMTPRLPLCLSLPAMGIGVSLLIFCVGLLGECSAALHCQYYS